MLKEAVDALDIQENKVYVDCTLGGGGHTEEILKKFSKNNQLISFDVDTIAIEHAKKRLENYKDNFTIVNSSYMNLESKLAEMGISKITGGVLFDLGASYYQLTSEERGFSFQKDSPLDMRFDMSADLTAYDVVNGFSEEDLANVIFEYGEERYSRRIARKIVAAREIKPVSTTFELADLVKSVVPFGKSKTHPATKTFQGIRICVNNERKNIENILKVVLTLLDKNARIAVISFHSLEDRIVKRVFKEYSSSCKCPPRQMICSCEPPIIELVTRKPILPSEEEVMINPPSRSAKLRVATKL